MTATATLDAAPSTLTNDSLQPLEALASQHGWTLDKTVEVAAALLGFVLDADPADPEPKAYAYQRNGARYSLQITR